MSLNQCLPSLRPRALALAVAAALPLAFATSGARAQSLQELYQAAYGS